MTFTRCMWPPVTLPQWLSGKESACNAGDTGDSGLIPGWGRSPGGRNGNPLQYSCLENPMGYSLWGHKESDMTSDNIWIFFDTTCSPIWGIPGGLSGIKSICQCRRHNESWAQSLVRKIPWRRKWQPTLVFLLGKFHGQRSLAGYSPKVRKVLGTTKHKHDRLAKLTHRLTITIPYPVSLIFPLKH